MSLREDVIGKAVEFLRDPQTASAPLEKKVEFLESKSLTKAEIEEAIKRSQDSYVLPNIIPQSKSQLEADKESIDEEFVRIEATLKEMGEVQKELKENELQKAEEISKTITSVEEMVNATKEKNTKVEDDLKVLKLEIDNLKGSFERAIEKQQASIAGEVVSIQHELQSLQALIKSKNSLTTEINGNGTKKSPVPAVSSIPSASEILKKNNFQKGPATAPATAPSESTLKSNPGSPNSTQSGIASGIPSWQRELSSAGSSSNSIPTWQQNMASSSQSIPSWQQAGQLSANNTSAEETNSVSKQEVWPEQEVTDNDLIDNETSEEIKEDESDKAGPVDQ
ncbi:Peroxisomal membrane protein PER10 [Cyberlindnera fabianii]|uniref:Peroxisomal membrane protein PEX14 n=1 Tax=Cyberlindnera fabianii TaxID=36022 RepID=A0A1V2LEM2_CYBFA|nr:Peroxisomal membrane protein PER10 [Cyberlindnera fabianii]